MEHLIQFGVTIDDDKIEQMVMKKATEEVMKQINDSIKEITKSPYYRSGDSELKNIFREEVRNVVNENKDKIIEEVIKQVSKNLMQTKKFIEAKEKILNSL